jgi:hypothetical protein
VDWWAQKLDSHTISIDNVVTAIAAGAQSSDLFAYNAKVAAAAAFTQHLDTAAERQAYSGDAANKIAIDYVASVKDLASAANAMDPGYIDSVIAHITGGTSGLGDAGIVGVPEMPAPHF